MKAVVYQGVSDIRLDYAADPCIDAPADALVSHIGYLAFAVSCPAGDATRMQSSR